MLGEPGNGPSSGWGVVTGADLRKNTDNDVPSSPPGTRVAASVSRIAGVNHGLPGGGIQLRVAADVGLPEVVCSPNDHEGLEVVELGKVAGVGKLGTCRHARTPNMSG